MVTVREAAYSVKQKWSSRGSGASPGRWVWMRGYCRHSRLISPSMVLGRPPVTKLSHLPWVCRSKIRFGPVNCGDAARSGSVTVFVYQAAENGLSPDAMGLEVGDGGRDGRFGAVWG